MMMVCELYYSSDIFYYNYNNIRINFFVHFSEQVPMFEMAVYRVPENNRAVPLCIDVGAIYSVPTSYTISVQHNNLSQPDGTLECAIIVK